MNDTSRLTLRAIAALLVLSTALMAQAGAEPAGAAATPNAAPTQSKTIYVCQMADHPHMASQGPAREFDRPGLCPSDGTELIPKRERLRVAVLVFDGVQDIDYAGPMEVFYQAGANIFTVAATTDTVRSTSGIRMQPDFDLEHAPPSDILLVPGGRVSPVNKNPLVVEWVRQRSADVHTVLSVCTGAFILGKAGLLDGLSATTIAGATVQLAKSFPNTLVVIDRRYVDSGKIVTTGGLSAGLDGALHVIARELGRLRAQDIARGLEYEWRVDGGGGFGLLAGNYTPDLATILPPDVMWERTVDQGDAKSWETRGHLELATSAQEFLNASVTKIKADAWILVPDHKPMRRSFVKTKDGRSWRLTLALATEKQASHYQLVLTIEHAEPSAARARKAAKG